MLDIKFIREHADLVKAGAEHKRITADVDQLLTVDAKIKPMNQELEGLQAERNRLSKEIAKASPDKRQELVAEVSKIKSTMESLHSALHPLQELFNELMLHMPQPARDDVPVGKDDHENVEIKKWGNPKSFDFKVRDHVELGRLHDIIDIERGVKLAGSRSYILKGAGAILEHALMRLAFDRLVAKGFTPLSVPVLVNEECMTGTGYFPTGKDQAYFVEKDRLALVGTSEVSLTSYYRDEILKSKQLPIKLLAHSSCFRREAGTYGKDTHGLYRVHQFQKIEQVIIGPNDPKKSASFHDELIANAEEIMQALELPYRVVYVCTGDLGQGQVRKHDIETWMPSREAYAETHSCSTFHEFQSRRLKMRYKDEDGKTKFCHTLNNTAIATPRVLIPLLENHQDGDGKIHIPSALHPYTGGLTTIG